MIFLSFTKVSRRAEFGPLGPYFATDFSRLPPESLFAGAESLDHEDDAQDSAHHTEEESGKHEERGDQRREDVGSSPNQYKRAPLVILGLDEGASEEEIEERYRELLKKYHPDKVSHLGEEFARVAHQKTIEIREAYEELSTH